MINELLYLPSLLWKGHFNLGILTSRQVFCFGLVWFFSLKGHVNEWRRNKSIASKKYRDGSSSGRVPGKLHFGF